MSEWIIKAITLSSKIKFSVDFYITNATVRFTFWKYSKLKIVHFNFPGMVGTI